MSKYLLESGGTDAYQLEDGSGVLLLEEDDAGGGEVFFEDRHPIEWGMKPQTAAGMGGVLVE